MSVRLLLTAEAWAEIAPILAAIQSRAGSPPARSDRIFIEAVLYLARTGMPWRDLPEDLGHWDAISNRFRRWAARGSWRRLWERLQAEACPITRHIFIDAPMVRAHQHAAQALSRSRGDLSTKIHAGCRDERTGVAIVLTARQCHESPTFETVFAQVPLAPSLTHAIMDQG